MPAKKTEQQYIDQINSTGKAEFVEWSGEFSGSRSRVVVKCPIDGAVWEVFMGSILYQDIGCPMCSGVYRYSKEEYVERLSAVEGINFVCWNGEFKGKRSRVRMKCDAANHEWVASIDGILNAGSRCPSCASKDLNESECVDRVNNSGKFSFVKWDSNFVGARSSVVVKCNAVGHVRKMRLRDIMYSHVGCAECASHGFDVNKRGTLYAMQSRCGTMVKIGIANNYNRRYRELINVTPFEFDCVDMIHGSGDVIRHLEKALHHTMKAVNFTESFNGHTEWMLWDPRLHDWFEFYRKLLNL